MKIRLDVISGYCLGTAAGIFFMKATEFFPTNTHQGWACVVLYIFMCLITVAFALEES